MADGRANSVFGSFCWTDCSEMNRDWYLNFFPTTSYSLLCKDSMDFSLHTFCRCVTYIIVVAISESCMRSYRRLATDLRQFVKRYQTASVLRQKNKASKWQRQYREREKKSGGIFQNDSRGFFLELTYTISKTTSTHTQNIFDRPGKKLARQLILGLDRRSDNT